MGTHEDSSGAADAPRAVAGATMSAAWGILVRPGPARTRAGLLLLCAVAAFVVGFIAVSPATAENLIKSWGYYYMLGLFGLFLWFAAPLFRERSFVWLGWIHRPGLAGVVIAAATVLTLWMDPFRHKILFDEHVLQATAYHMHATKEVGTVIRAYDLQGTWLPIDTFLDKRPYFFTFLLSLLHDLTGYRIINVYVLNAALAPIFFGLVYWLARELAGRRPAMLVVLLLGTMPLLGQQATGAGMELHNLVMLVGVAVAAVLYLRAPGSRRLSLLIVATVLLAQSRYESVIFVVPVAAVICVGWRRQGRIVLPWTAVAAPLLLIPYAWHNRIVGAKPLLWQLGEGQTARFSLEYLPGNLDGAWAFFFNRGTGLANSWYLSALGFGAVGWWLWRAWRWSREPGRAPLGASAVVVLAMSSGILANFVLLLFYYWSRLDDVMASRFALPMCVLLALLGAVFLGHFDARGWRATRWAAIGLLGWSLGWGVRATASRPYTAQNLVMQELEWEHEELRKRGDSLLYITNKSTIPFVLWRIPSVINGVGRQRGAQIAYHLKEGTFKEVIVAQSLRPTSADGNLGVSSEDLMPPTFRLETIAEKRFGGRWARLSRLVAIEGEPGAGAQ